MCILLPITKSKEVSRSPEKVSVVCNLLVFAQFSETQYSISEIISLVE